MDRIRRDICIRQKSHVVTSKPEQIMSRPWGKRLSKIKSKERHRFINIDVTKDITITAKNNKNNKVLPHPPAQRPEDVEEKGKGFFSRQKAAKPSLEVIFAKNSSPGRNQERAVNVVVVFN